MRLISGDTAFYWATCESHNLEVLKCLLGAGADINADRGGQGRTALRYAVKSWRRTYVRFMIDAGADVNKRGTIDLTNTPLELAIQEYYDRDFCRDMCGFRNDERINENNSRIIIRSLLSAGAKVRGDSGDTLIDARESCNSTVVEVLRCVEDRGPGEESD